MIPLMHVYLKRLLVHQPGLMEIKYYTWSIFFLPMFGIVCLTLISELGILHMIGALHLLPSIPHEYNYPIRIVPNTHVWSHILYAATYALPA
jgi:hypothetical protein